MRAEDHRKVAEIVCKLLQNRIDFIDSTVIESLKEGSVWPDRVKERRAHHSRRETDIVRHLGDARHWFLRDNWTASSRELGKAFHYIADMSCLHEREADITDVREVRITQLPMVKTACDIYPFLYQRLSASRSPYTSLENAVETCYAVAELTWRAMDKPVTEELWTIESIRKLEKCSRLTAIGVGLLYFGFVAWAASSGFSFEIPFHLPLIVAVIGIILTVTGAVLVRSGPKIENWHFAAMWYNLE